MIPQIQFAVSTIETPRLRLRRLRSDDIPEYFALCSDVEVMKTYGTALHQTTDDTRTLLGFLEAAFESRQMVRWAITERGSEKLIGDVGFWRFVKERCRAEIGAKLAREHWSKGYISEALTGVIDYGFQKMNLHSVEANVDPNNRAAIKLVEKVGFQQEGVLQEHSYDFERGQFIDTFLFSVVAGRWEPRFTISH